MFEIIKFNNDACTGDSKNGTCYTRLVCKILISFIYFSVGFFEIIKFPNDACNGDSKNGTCYTA